VTADDGGGSARALLLDIEGTTTPLAFVVSVLFPYARARLEDFISDNAGAPEIDVLIADLRAEHAAAAAAAEPVAPWRDDTPAATRASACSFAGWLMDRDRKSTALKELQGRIWEHGYRSAALVGQVFPDVPEALACGRTTRRDLLLGQRPRAAPAVRAFHGWRSHAAPERVLRYDDGTQG
jgi:enolase-phosphatase E1